MSDAARDNRRRARSLPRHTGQGGRGGRRVGFQGAARAAPHALVHKGLRGGDPRVAGPRDARLSRGKVSSTETIANIT